jgi:hypothetical protein
MQGKLNQLISSWQKGTIRTSISLGGDGYSDDLLSKFVKGKWLESFGFGAYKLYDNNIEWFGALYALQTELNSTIHVAGKSALQLKGLAHNITGDFKKIDLFHNDSKYLPKWFLKYKWNTTITFTKTSKYGNFNRFLTDVVLDGITIKVSSPELAIMEMLLNIPLEESYNEANLIMEGLITLRSKIISELLLECKSVKVKRLFMHLAERHNHSWFKKLNLVNVDFGKGKRQIVSNGVLDSKYLITVPRV